MRDPGNSSRIRAATSEQYPFFLIQQQVTDPGQAGGQVPGSDGLGIDELAVLLRVPAGELRRARELGLLPGTDSAGRWTRQDADGIAASWPQTAAVLADTREVGASRAAELL